VQEGPPHGRDLADVGDAFAAYGSDMAALANAALDAGNPAVLDPLVNPRAAEIQANAEIGIERLIARYLDEAALGIDDDPLRTTIIKIAGHAEDAAEEAREANGYTGNPDLLRPALRRLLAIQLPLLDRIMRWAACQSDRQQVLEMSKSLSIVIDEDEFLGQPQEQGVDGLKVQMARLLAGQERLFQGLKQKRKEEMVQWARDLGPGAANQKLADDIQAGKVKAERCRSPGTITFKTTTREVSRTSCQMMSTDVDVHDTDVTTYTLLDARRDVLKDDEPGVFSAWYEAKVKVKKDVVYVSHMNGADTSYTQHCNVAAKVPGPRASNAGQPFSVWVRLRHDPDTKAWTYRVVVGIPPNGVNDVPCPTKNDRDARTLIGGLFPYDMDFIPAVSVYDFTNDPQPVQEGSFVRVKEAVKPWTGTEDMANPICRTTPIPKSQSSTWVSRSGWRRSATMAFRTTTVSSSRGGPGTSGAPGARRGPGRARTTRSCRTRPSRPPPARRAPGPARPPARRGRRRCSERRRRGDRWRGPPRPTGARPPCARSGRGTRRGRWRPGGRPD